MPTTDAIRRANQATSLKLPAALKSQLEVVAEKAGLSVHAFMVQAIADAVQSAGLRESFQQDSAAALHAMQASGVGYELGAVRAYFSQLAAHRQGLASKPADLIPVRLV